MDKQEFSLDNLLKTLGLERYQRQLALEELAQARQRIEELERALRRDKSKVGEADRGPIDIHPQG